MSESANDAFYAALGDEEQRRRAAYFRQSEPLLGCPVVTFTWRHLNELSFAGNAFVSAREPVKDDVFFLLWRLNPAFRRRDGEMPNLDMLAVSRGARRPSRWQSLRQLWRCSRAADWANPNAVEFPIRSRIEAAFQDRPAPRKDDNEFVSPLLAVATWFDYVASEFATWGHTKDEVADYGVAWTFQMLRAQGIKHGREKDYIPPSAKLYRFED